jgi:hypothetical protein
MCVFTIERKQVPLIFCRHMTLRLARSLHLLSSCPIHVRDPLPQSVVQRVLMHVLNLFDQFFKVFLSVCVSVCVCIPSFLFLSTTPCFFFLFPCFCSAFLLYDWTFLEFYMPETKICGKRNNFQKITRFSDESLWRFK